jgi:hypothetical protein
MSVPEKIHALAQVRAMISHDDNNEIANAVWMPEEAFVVVLVNGSYAPSEAVQFLEKSGRIVRIVPGIGDGGSVEKVANPELEEETEFLGDGQYEVNLEFLQSAIGEVPSRVL